MLVGPTLLAKAGLTSSPNQTLRGPDIVRDASIHAELTSVFEELQRPLIDVECSSRVIATLRRLLPHASSQPRPLSDIAAAHPVGVFRTRDYLREHAVTPVTLDELASVAALSKFYLIRAFQHAFGLTPHSYQMQLRLARARRLLAEGRPLSHVTYDAGFADQSHLTRRFAAFYGLTPARYARQVTMGHCTTLAPAASASWSPSSAA
jgi:AraC-like DNA-binding protein